MECVKCKPELATYNLFDRAKSGAIYWSGGVETTHQFSNEKASGGLGSIRYQDVALSMSNILFS